jgi:hypothetical protein
VESLTDNNAVEVEAVLNPFSLVHVNLATLRGDALCSFVERIKIWIPTYTTWVVDDAGIAKGKNLHAIYRFGLSLSNAECLEPVDQITDLALCAKKLGLPVTFSVHSAAIERNEQKFMQLAESGSLSSVIVATGFEASHPVNWEVIHRNVLHVKNLGIAVSFVGDYSQIYKHVLVNRWLDEKSFSVFPRQVTQHHVGRRNCHGRVGCYVAPDGLIYACQSLYGVSAAEMGSIDIDRPFRNQNLSALRRSMAQWELQGPVNALDFTPQERRNGDMCRSHRASLGVTESVA